MKVLSKVNRGLIATIIVIIAVIIYVVTVTVGQEAHKAEIKKACTDYITMDIKYKLLPTEFIDANKLVPKSEQDSILSNLTKDIKANYINNTALVDTVIKGYKDNLEAQFKNGSNLQSIKRQIIKYDDIVFDGNTAMISFTSMTAIDTITKNSTDPNGATTPIIQTINGQTNDYITFENVDGKWKVVTAYLSDPQSQNGTNGAVINKY